MRRERSSSQDSKEPITLPTKVRICQSYFIYQLGMYASQINSLEIPYFFPRLLRRGDKDAAEKVRMTTETLSTCLRLSTNDMGKTIDEAHRYA